VLGPVALVVEDNAANRYMATFLLSHAGFVVHAAEDGRTAHLRARELQPDVIVMDIQMPGMDGYETATALLADPATKHIPIVAATSYVLAGDRARAEAVGFVDYIEKPFDAETFAARIRRACERSVTP
jgi:two-component system, cell cycle response regulator DivK